MEGTEPTTKQSTAGRNGTQEADQTLLNASKPLHRFVQKEPRSLGVTQQSRTNRNKSVWNLVDGKVGT